MERDRLRLPEPNNFDNYPRVKPEVIEGIVGMQGLQREVFLKNYFESNDFVRKYRLARDLVLDGRFDRPSDLLGNFLHPRAEVPDDQQAVVEPLRERFHFLLIQKGLLPPSSMDADVSERILREELKRREDFRDLIDEGWPIEVVGQLMTVDLFTEITDSKKIEEYRAWTTRGIIREYLGVISGRSPRRDDMTVSDILDRIPKRIFSDPNGIKFHLVEHYIEQRLMRSITDAGLQEGLASIESVIDNSEDTDKKEFLHGLTDRFYDIATYPLDGEFKGTVTLKGQEKPFPSFEQRTFCYDFIRNGTRLLAAETGLGKTGTAFLAMENSDAERVLVIAPAGGKETWALEDEKLFKQSENVYIVDGSQDIETALASGKKYIVVSQELLGLTEHDPRLAKNLDRLVQEAGIDGAIIDEIDNLNNPKAISAQTAVRLVNQIRQNYESKKQKPEVEAPIVGLTATPIRSRLSDLNVAMGLLYPDKYAISHGDSTATRKTFSDSHLNRPDLVYFTLIGEKRMFRWEQATGVQEFKYETVPVEVSAFEEYLYTFIANEVPTDQLNKIRILEDCLFNPLLIKAEVRTLARGSIPTFDIDQTMRRISRVVAEWKKIRNIKEPNSIEDFLSADRLVELGLGDIVLATFFSDLLENGIDTLVDELTQGSQDASLQELRRFWRPRGISTKYKTLREMVEESLEWKTGLDGKPARQKVFIVSPSRKQGRTGNVLQREISGEDGSRRNLYAQYELDTINDSNLVAHVKDWSTGYCGEEDILLLDGTVTVGRPRDMVIGRWVNDPNASVLVVTLEATYQSRDFTLNAIEDETGRSISGVRKIFLAPPWYYQQLKQMGGRSQRQGQLVPVDVKVLQSRDLIDQGKGEAVLYTYLLSRMALSGIVLSPGEQVFFDSKRLGNRIPLQSAESRFLRDALNWVRGAGENKLEDYLKKRASFREETTQDQLIAEKFFDNGKDEFHITGYNAELVAYLSKSLVGFDSKILSLGAGTLLLQRKLKKGVDNVDLNPHMMDAGWVLAGQYGGSKIEGKASSLSEETFPNGSYDLVDCAFALHWSKLESSDNGNVVSSERVKILSQVHRVLKNNGAFILTLPEKSLDNEKFETFCTALEEHFGFQVDRAFSGRSFGRSKIGLAKRLGWCIVGRKVTNINLDGLALNNLEFANETGEWISTGTKKKKGSGKGIQGRDYPIPGLELQFDQYEIINDRQEVTVITYQDDIVQPIEKENEVVNGNGADKIDITASPVVESEILDIDFLKGDTKEDYREYRTTFMRPFMRIAKRTWKEIEEVEAMCSDIFKDIQLKKGPINSRLVAYSLILKEVRRRASMTINGGREVNGND